MIRCKDLFESMVVAININAIDYGNPTKTEPYFQHIGAYVREWAKEKGLETFSFRIIPDVGGIYGIQIIDNEMNVYTPDYFDKYYPQKPVTEWIDYSVFHREGKTND